MAKEMFLLVHFGWSMHLELQESDDSDPFQDSSVTGAMLWLVWAAVSSRSHFLYQRGNRWTESCNWNTHHLVGQYLAVTLQFQLWAPNATTITTGTSYTLNGMRVIFIKLLLLLKQIYYYSHVRARLSPRMRSAWSFIRLTLYNIVDTVLLFSLFLNSYFMNPLKSLWEPPTAPDGTNGISRKPGMSPRCESYICPLRTKTQFRFVYVLCFSERVVPNCTLNRALTWPLLGSLIAQSHIWNFQSRCFLTYGTKSSDWKLGSNAHSRQALLPLLYPEIDEPALCKAIRGHSFSSISQPSINR